MLDEGYDPANRFEGMRMAQDQVRFDGRAIVVTGAGRGIGRAHARLLASRGAKVVVADNGAAMDGDDPSTAPALAVVAEIEAAGGEAVACTADIATEAGSNAAIEASLVAFGRIDGVLHNASTVPDNAPAESMSSRDFDLVMRVNTYAAAWMTRASWPHMAAQNYGRILFMSSAGIFGSEGNAPYAAAKAAVIGLMRCYALEGEGKGIRVNVVAPGAATRMTERLPSSPFADWFLATMRPERVSPGVAFLMSEACTIQGEIFHIGGGRISRLRLAESVGVLASEESIEEAADLLGCALAETEFFYPSQLTERALRVAKQLGYGGGMGAGAFTVTPSR
jgi:NAD(P)-dependent dehydrogenase (short-subunit alcohol dehydrogenase family)